MDRISESYVRLVLAVGVHDASYVDAYYGPAQWRASVERERRSIPQIRAGAERLIADIRAAPGSGDELETLRRRFLIEQLTAMLARLDLLAGKRLRFDDESRVLYDAVAPVVPEARFDEVLARIDRLIPGEGTLNTRIDALRARVVIPSDKLDAVFAAAIAECRARTRAPHRAARRRALHRRVREGQAVGRLQLVPGQLPQHHPGEHRPADPHRSRDRSGLPRGLSRPPPPERAARAAAGAGAGLDRVLGATAVRPDESSSARAARTTASSSRSRARSGSSSSGDSLYPLAGLDPARAATYAEVTELLLELRHATNQAARRYLDGEIDADAVAAYLTRYGLAEPENARKMVKFIEANRSYVINYNLGRDLVRAWIEKQGAGDRRWAAFERLVASPMTASDLGP